MQAIDILCFHANANFEDMKRAVPFEDTLYITILRNPINVSESVYNFYRFSNSLGTTFEEFILDKRNRTVRNISRRGQLSPQNYEYYTVEFDDHWKAPYVRPTLSQ